MYAGNAKFPVTNEGDNGAKEETQWVDGIRSVKGKAWKNMEARMGRPLEV
jgi:hypothetical protein